MSTHLTSDEQAFYEENGWVGPFDVGAPELVSDVRRAIAPYVEARKSASVHLRCKPLYDLSCHPQIAERAAALFGKDLIIWRTILWIKGPGGAEYNWHQDSQYYEGAVARLKPNIGISAWMALSDATLRSGCMYVVSGSHKSVVKHTASLKDRLRFWKSLQLRVPDGDVNKEKIVPLEAKPGQFYLLHHNVMHSSGRNETTGTRIGLAVRMTAAQVKVKYHPLVRLAIGEAPVHLCGQAMPERNRMARLPWEMAS